VYWIQHVPSKQDWTLAGAGLRLFVSNVVNVLNHDPLVFWMGTAGGGHWKAAKE
jgi:hypothetical protein